jgi:single-strand DNA-binding protein
LKKGSKVYLEGQLETRKWTDQSGAEKYTTEVVLRQFRGELTMLDGRGAGGGGAASGGAASGGAASGEADMGEGPAPAAAPSRGKGGSGLDDDIPF